MSSEVHRLHVGGLPADVDEPELARRFQPFGAVVAAEVIRATDGGQSRGFGYVSLQASEAEVERSIKAYTGTRWRGQKLSVWYANESYLDRLEREWAEQRSEREVVSATSEGPESVGAWDKTAALRVRPSPRVAVIKAKPGKTNRHKRKFDAPTLPPAKPHLFSSGEDEPVMVGSRAAQRLRAGEGASLCTSYEDEPHLVASTAAHRRGVQVGEGASESDEEDASDISGGNASSDRGHAEDGDTEGEEERVVVEVTAGKGKGAIAEAAVLPQPKAAKKGTSLISAALPHGLEDELAEAELFMRGKAKAMDALRRPVIKVQRREARAAGEIQRVGAKATGEIQPGGARASGGSARPRDDGKADAGSAHGGSGGSSVGRAEASAGCGRSSGLPKGKVAVSGIGEDGSGAVGAEFESGDAFAEGGEVRAARVMADVEAVTETGPSVEAGAAADAGANAQAEVEEAERERERSASLRVLSELLGQPVGELERDDGRESRVADRKRRWGEWANPDAWQIGAKFDPEADAFGAKFDPEADAVGAKFDPEADPFGAKTDPEADEVGAQFEENVEQVGDELNHAAAQRFDPEGEPVASNFNSEASSPAVTPADSHSRLSADSPAGWSAHREERQETGNGFTLQQNSLLELPAAQPPTARARAVGVAGAATERVTASVNRAAVKGVDRAAREDGARVTAAVKGAAVKGVGRTASEDVTTASAGVKKAAVKAGDGEASQGGLRVGSAASKAAVKGAGGADIEHAQIIEHGQRARAAVKKAASKPQLLQESPERQGPLEAKLEQAGEDSLAAQKDGPAVLQTKSASLRREETPALEARAKARSANTPQPNKAKSPNANGGKAPVVEPNAANGGNAAPGLEPKAASIGKGVLAAETKAASGSKGASDLEPKPAFHSAVRLRGLFVGGSSGDSFALSGLLGDMGADASFTPATGGTTPQDLSTPAEMSDQEFLFQSPFESSRAGGSEAGEEASAMADAGGPPVAAETAWAAPETPFMRQESEAELLRSWRRGRSEARHAYKKTHQDAVRQRRKDRATFKKPAAGRTA
jgi:hypothetical protein